MVEALDFTAKPTILVGQPRDRLEVVGAVDPPDLILLDVMMPALSGYEVCTRLEQDPATRNIPILFLTALAASKDETKGLERDLARSRELQDVAQAVRQLAKSFDASTG